LDGEELWTAGERSRRSTDWFSLHFSRRLAEVTSGG
jgi:oxalate decarboxylase/phosphoglucose isomerase-like protein (cupin superfamily)